MRFARSTVLLPLLYVSCPAWAAEREAIFVSPRAAGRGDTFVGAFDSTEAARLNPAALAESRSTFQLSFLQFDGVVGQNSVDTISDLMKLSSVGKGGFGFLRSFDDKFGKRQYVRGQLSALSMRIKSFEVQFFGTNASWLELRDPTTPQAEFESDTFAGAQFSYAMPLGKQFLLGATFRPMYRLYIHGQMGFTDILEFVPPSETEFDDYAQLQSGLGYGGDLGLIWRPTPALRLGLTVQNVGDTSFENSDETKIPPKLESVISTGGLYRLKFGSWDLDLSGEMRDLMNRQGLNLTRLLHWGAEFGRSFYGKDHDVGVTTGLREGYITAGAFIDAWIFRLDIANYAVELGETPGQRMDRRWAATLQSTMSF
ncbi:hypothetical protein [Oligoflexus tunisiensis]|uniref:hypothetical protein n=1 Tax=Oligoflexus tunisiensis TaxID=708132 RepID=UPI00114C8B90|nr:hypothetical protein [Oligoflexus tunisiensis]